MTHPLRPMMQDRTGTGKHRPHFQQGLVPSLFVAGAGMSTTELVLACCCCPPATTKPTSSTTKDVENTTDHRCDKQEGQEEHNPHSTYHVGTADDDHHDDSSFFYLHYDRMCKSATAQDNHYEHHDQEEDDERCPRDHSSSCCHNHVLGRVLPPSSLMPGHEQDQELEEQSPPPLVKVELDEEQRTHSLHSFCSAPLRDGGRMSQISARGDYDACPDTTSDSEDSFDDEIYRLFGDTNEQQGAIVRSNTGLQSSLKPRTTPRATEDSMMVDSSVPSSVTLEAETATISITRTKFKLVSPSPQPVFVNSEESSPTARNSTSRASRTATTTGSLPLCSPWWQSQDDIEDDFTPSAGPAVSTKQHCPLSKEIPFPEKKPGEVPAIPVGGETTYIIMSSSHKQETFVLPKGKPMTPPPLLYSACRTTTTGKASATSPRPLVPFLMDKESFTSLDPEKIDSPIKAHLVSPLLPTRSSHMRASSSKTISAFADHDTRRNPIFAQDQQARKRLLFGNDELKKSGPCSPASCCSFSHQVKKSHRPTYLHDNDTNFDNVTSLRSILGQTRTNKLLGPSWQSPPVTTGNGPRTFNPTSRSADHHDGATPATSSLLYPHHDPRHVVVGKEKGIEPPSASSSSLSSTSDKRLHFWDFQSRTWTAKFREANAYWLKNGHCRIPENYSENIALGRWAKRQRAQYKVHQRTSCLSSRWGDKNITMQYQNHDHDATAGKNNTTTPYNVEEGSRRIASSSSTSPFEYLGGQNCQEKGTPVHHDKEKGATTFESSCCPRPTSTISTRSSTKVDDNWNEEEIDTESHRRNSPAVERSSSCNPLTEERIRLLDSIDFVWDLQASDWFHRHDQLLEFKLMHGHADVPQRYPQNQPLSTWVRTQRRSYIKGGMLSDRIDLLDRMGFDWENPSAKRRRMS